MASSYIECELERKISEMSNYLDRIVMTDQKDHHHHDAPSSSEPASYGIAGFQRRTPPLSYIPMLSPSMAVMNTSANNFIFPLVSPQYPLTNVTSALANRLSTCNSTLRFVDPVHYQRNKKWGIYKKPEREPDTSEIDINQTFAELGLTPESLTNNEVYKLFAVFDKLAFYIHADYCSEQIYEGRTVPNTMSVSVQTRHAVWSSTRLLRQLRGTLRKYTNVPLEHQDPFDECKKSLVDLGVAISQLEVYKYCVLEHRNGKYVSPESRENLEPLLSALNRVIECVGKSRSYVRVIEWALNKSPTPVLAIAGRNHEESSLSRPEVCSLEPTTKRRPLLARRYIG